VAWAEAYLRTKWHLDPSVWPQQTWPKIRGGSVPLGGGVKLGLHLAQYGPGQGLPPCQVPSGSIQPFGHNRHGPKIGGCSVPLFGGGRAGFPSTMSLGPMPTSLPSGILTHPAIWPQQIWAKNWGAVSFWGRGLGPHVIQCGQAQAYLYA